MSSTKKSRHTFGTRGSGTNIQRVCLSDMPIALQARVQEALRSNVLALRDTQIFALRARERRVPIKGLYISITFPLLG